MVRAEEIRAAWARMHGAVQIVVGLGTLLLFGLMMALVLKVLSMVYVIVS